MSVIIKPFEVKSYTKKELRMLYGVSGPTFLKWLNKIPDFNHLDAKVFTPKEVEIIIIHCGTP